MMKLKALTIALLIAATWAMPANAGVLYPDNPDWVLYQDPFGAYDPDAAAPLHGYESFYDGYMEATQGDTFTLYIVVNRFPPFGYTQVRGYVGDLYYGGSGGNAEFENYPATNYTGSDVHSTQQNGITGSWYGGWVQVLNQSWSMQNVYASDDTPPYTYGDPYTIMGWDITVQEDAPVGEVTLPLKFWFYDGTGYPNGQHLGQVDIAEAITINILDAPPEYPTGDFDHDYDVDKDDIDALCDFIRNLTAYDAEFDISADGTTEGTDGVVDILDLDYHVRSLVYTDVGEGTEYGDFNLDGLVDTTDLTRLATNYGDDDWKWDDGNANRHIDTDIDNTDLTILATYFNFGVPDVIPEPITLSLLALGAAAVLRKRRSRVARSTSRRLGK